MGTLTGLSGNEIYCLAQKGFKPRNIVVGNSVYSLGILNSLGTGIKSLLGGELVEVTKLIEAGRRAAYTRMLEEAYASKADGITGVRSELIFHGSSIEFLSIGSGIHSMQKQELFSTPAPGQELYAQIDAGFTPICFSFGNVAYSMGVARGISGALKTLVRGEIKEYSELFNHTRHLALQRIIDHAKQHRANAVLGIQTTILPFSGITEMLMIGTASYKEDLNESFITSDLTNIEMWNLATFGYRPQQLLLGASVYSLGVVGNLSSLFKSVVRGEIPELTRLIYEAREHALGILHDEAKAIGSDDIMGVKTYIYQLGGGLIEFLAVGTAVKKVDGLKNASNQLLPQAFTIDKDSFYSSVRRGHVHVNQPGSARVSTGWSSVIPVLVVILAGIYYFIKNFL